MKILVISDIEHPALYGDHFDPGRWQHVDLVISCGDLPSAYLSFLVTMLRVPVLYVRGNHDHHYSKEPPEGCDNIDGRLVVHRGVRILGLEGSMWYNGEGVQLTERQMRWKVMRLMPRIWRHGGVDIVATHAPPAGVHEGGWPSHSGFKSFHKVIATGKPAYFLHGHRHTCYGRCRKETLIGGTSVINIYGYRVLELPEGATVVGRSTTGTVP